MRKSFLAAALLFVAVSARADQLLPIGEGTSWEYDSTETLTGAAPVHSVVIVRAGKQLLDGKEVAKLETLSNNVVTKIELVSVDENGVACLARSGKDGKIAKLNPPEPIIAAPLKIGGTWETEGEAAGMKMHQRFTVLAEESVTVPAGKFRAFHLQCKDSSLMSITLDRWFVPGTGFVKETTVVRGPGVLQSMTLELKKITEVLSKPVAATSPAAPKPPEPSPVSSPKSVAAASPVAPPSQPAASPEENTAPAPPPKRTHRRSLERSGRRAKNSIQVQRCEHLRPLARPRSARRRQSSRGLGRRRCRRSGRTQFCHRRNRNGRPGPRCQRSLHSGTTARRLGRGQISRRILRRRSARGNHQGNDRKVAAVEPAVRRERIRDLSPLFSRPLGRGWNATGEGQA